MKLRNKKTGDKVWVDIGSPLIKGKVICQRGSYCLVKLAFGTTDVYHISQLSYRDTFLGKIKRKIKWGK